MDLGQMEILLGQIVHVLKVAIGGEQGWVGEQSLCAHHPINAGLLQAPLIVLISLNPAISKHRYDQPLLDLPNDLPINSTNPVLVHLLSAAVHSQQLAAGFLNGLRECEGALFGVENPDFAEYGDGQPFGHCFDYVGDEVGLFEEVGTVVASFGDGLRAAHVDVDRVGMPFDHLRRFQHQLRVVPAELGD
jgi:hypothetical protein